jgi:hypothetical protein
MGGRDDDGDSKATGRSDASVVERLSEALGTKDMAPAQIGDQLECCTLEQARRAVSDVAALHAAWWNSPAPANLAWMPTADDPIHLSDEGVYQQCWPGFLQLAAGRLPLDLKRIGEKLASRINSIQRELTQPA